MSNQLHNLESLTVQTAKAALGQGLAAIKAGQTVIDLAALKVADSSAVAVLLEWKRAARRAGVPLAYVNLPSGVQSLAALYGVDDFLVESPANLHHH